MPPIGILNFLSQYNAVELLQYIDEQGFLNNLRKHVKPVAAQLVKDKTFIVGTSNWTPKQYRRAIRSAIFLLLRDLIKSNTQLPTLVKNSTLADVWRDLIDDKVVPLVIEKFTQESNLDDTSETFVDTVARSIVEVIF